LSNAEGLQAYRWMVGAPWFWIEMERWRRRS
jgi:hypothetical protein